VGGKFRTDVNWEPPGNEEQCFFGVTEGGEGPSKAARISESRTCYKSRGPSTGRKKYHGGVGEFREKAGKEQWVSKVEGNCSSRVSEGEQEEKAFYEGGAAAGPRPFNAVGPG